MPGLRRLASACARVTMSGRTVVSAGTKGAISCTTPRSGVGAVGNEFWGPCKRASQVSVA